MVLIANLLCTVLSRMIKRHVSFSQIVTMLRLALMYYTNFIAFMEDPQKDESVICAERAKSPPPEPSLFDWGGACFSKKSPKSYSKGLWAGFFCRFEVYRTAIIINLVGLDANKFFKFILRELVFVLGFPSSCKFLFLHPHTSDVQPWVCGSVSKYSESLGIR